MKRTVIKIDEDLCNGCGLCVSGCHEGALQLINGKAVMISDLYCDGLGACIGDCPLGAITLEEREAVPYDEIAVMERIAPKGESVVLAHLKHLIDHNEREWVQQGVNYLKEHGLKYDLTKIGIGAGNSVDRDNFGLQSDAETLACGCSSSVAQEIQRPQAGGCPGSMAREIKPSQTGFTVAPASGMQSSQFIQQSELRQFPVQLHLVNPQAGFFRDADLLLAADCTAFATGEFHSRYLKGKSLAIACPKLDSNTDVYINKLVEMIDVARINTLTLLVMEVPCCSGLVRIAQHARERAQRNIPIKLIVISIAGELIEDKWL